MRKIFGFLAVLLFLLAGSTPVRAQMSDDAVVRYALQALQAGKSEQQIGQELLSKGVTPVQLQRLKQRYESNQNNFDLGDKSAKQTSSIISRSRISPSQDSMAMTLQNYPGQGIGQGLGYDSMGFPMTDSLMLSLEPEPSRKIFGHDVFKNRSLTFEPNVNMATPPTYRLGPGDEVIIDVWGENENSLREEISPEGNIMIEQVGPVYLNGLTIQEANEKIRMVFGQIYAGVSGEKPSSDVRVTLGQLRSIQVNILGEVAKPGTYRLSSFATVFHALYRAGGVTPIGSLRDIRVMRNGNEVARIDLYDLLINGRQSNDIRLEEGDVILVAPYEQLVDVSGKVKRPMAYELKADENLGQLLKYAGGFTGDAYRDAVRITRRVGKEQQLYSVTEPKYDTWLLMDGDSVEVEAVLDRFANRVEVRGAVYREGFYEVGDEILTVRQLIDRAQGLKGDAFPGRAQLLREQEDLSIEVLAIDLAGLMAGEISDIELRPNDVLVIPSINELKENETLTIDGEVALPGDYPYAAHMTVEDLIMQAGGLLDGASTAKVEVSRRIKDPQSLEPSSELGTVFTFAIKDGLVVDGGQDFELHPFDIVDVRRSPAYRVQERVTLEGEVVFSGGYALTKKNERLSDIVKRAGGLTPDAYTHGARLIRKMNGEEKAVEETKIRMALQNQRGDSLSMDKLKINEYYSVGIELDKALSEPGSDYDMVLREGDRLVIPQYVSTVSILGEVMYPNTVLYLKGKNLQYYVDQAGGYGYRAKKSRAYIVYMNGTVARVRGLGKTLIEPGCAIIIPSKHERKGMALQTIASLATSAASIGTMAATIASLTK